MKGIKLKINEPTGVLSMIPQTKMPLQYKYQPHWVDSKKSLHEVAEQHFIK